MRTHYGPWQPCWISNQHQKHKSSRGPSNEHFWQVWFNSVQWFQRRRFKCEKPTDGRRTLNHNKSSHGLWPGELTSHILVLILVCKKRDMLTDKMTHCHSLQSHKTNQKYGNMKMSRLFMDGRKKKMSILGDARFKIYKVCERATCSHWLLVILVK